MKKTKGIISLVLAALLLFGSAPASAIAGINLLSATLSASASTPDDGGVCGSNATWEFYQASGLLTVSGSGSMYNFDNSGNKAPWSTYRGSIRSVQIASGITSVGSFAFRECSVLTSAALPNSLQRIERNAFSYSGITSITIPVGVTYFGNLAFGYCSSLSSIVYNAANAFDAESSGVFMLSSSQVNKPEVSVTIGSTVERIPGWLFYFSAPANALNITYVSFSQSVKSLGQYAFYNCSTITSLNLPDGLTDIHSYAINNCAGITSLTIPESVTTLHDFAVGYNDESKIPGFMLSVYRDSAGLAYAQQKEFDYILLNPVRVTGVSLNKSEQTIYVNGNYQLIHTVWPLNATDQGVTWKSYNTAVAEVNSTGLVYAKAPGTAVIEVKTDDGDCPATCTVTVKNPVLTLSAESASIFTEDEIQLTATVSPEGVMPSWRIKESSADGVIGINVSQDKCVVTGLEAGTAVVEAKILVNGIEYFAYCDITVTQLILTGVVIQSNPATLSYFVGDTLDTSGLKLKASYNNHADRIITSGFDCSPTLLDAPGNQQISVTYKGFTNYFNVHVEPVVMTGIEITSPPSKTSYYVGESLVTDGIQVYAVFNNGGRSIIESGGLDYDVVVFDSAGTVTVNVSHNGFSDSFEVTVTAVGIVGIAFETDASVTSYFTGDDLDTSGLSIRVYYNNGDSSVLTSGFSCTPSVLNAAGTQQIKVTYGGFNLYYNVFVSQTAISSIAIETEPTKKDYYVGDTLDTEGLTVRVKFNNGNHEIIDSGFRCNPTSFSSGGQQEISVTYEGHAASFSVNVTAVILERMEINSLPDKLTYFVGDSLNTFGLSLLLSYNSGKTEIITSGFTCSPLAFAQSGTKTVEISYGGFLESFEVTVLEVVMTGISINTPPTKTEYFTGESLSISGLTIKTHYNNGSSEILTSGFSCSPEGVFTSGGTHEITVSHGGFNTTFSVNVTVVAMTGISINTPPTKTEYFTGESLSISGLTIKTHYNNGFSEILTSGFSCSPDGVFTSGGTHEITVSHGGFNTTFSVNVTAVAMTGISVFTLPTKTEYFMGEALNTSGLTIKTSYNNGFSEVITTGFTCSPTVLEQAGENHITVMFGGFETSFTVNVSDVLAQSISIRSMPSKTVYFVGETLSTSGLTINVIYGSGQSEIISEGFSCSPTTLTSAGTMSVTVSYMGLTAQFNVVVNAVAVTGISIKTAPTKTSYTYRDAFNPSGLELYVNYSNGTTETVTSGFVCSGYNIKKVGSQAITVNYLGHSTSFNITVKYLWWQWLIVIFLFGWIWY